MDFETFGDHPFTTAMARAVGVDGAALTRAVAHYRLTRPLVGVYVRSDVDRTPLLLARAASLVVGSSSVICDRTAASSSSRRTRSPRRRSSAGSASCAGLWRCGTPSDPAARRN
jgi:hypothetical protein